MCVFPLLAHQLAAARGFCLLTQWLFHGEMEARLAEAVVVWIIGYALAHWIATVGLFVQYAAYASFMNWMLDNAIFERQGEAMSDAEKLMYLQQERIQEAKRGK